MLTDPPDFLLTQPEYANFRRCSERTIERERASGTGCRYIKIGRGVFIGARAIVLKGVTIGDRAVIGAAAVITKDVPAGHVAAGNPARVFPPSGPPR